MVFNRRFPFLSPLELLKSLKTIKQDWNRKTPLHKWSYICSFGKAIFKFVDFPLYEENQTLSWYSFFTWAYVTLYSVCAINTIIYYLTEDEFQMGLSCTCISAPVIAVIPMLVQLTSKKRHAIRKLLNFPGQHLYHNNRDESEYNRICSDELNFTARTLMMKMTLLLIGPIYMFFTQGIKTTTTDLKFPFIDEKSPYQFILNSVLQIIFYVHGGASFCGIETTFSLFENVVRAAPKLIQCEFRQLVQEFKNEDISKTQFRIAFRNTLIKCLDVIRYSEEIEQMLYWRNFLMFPIFCYSIGMSFYCQLTMDFAAGYGMALMSYVQMFYLCETGELVYNEQFAHIIYDVEWTTLPRDLQKDVLNLIHRVQNGAKLTVGPYATVNRELFNVVSSKIYSFIMFLLNFST